MAKYMLIVDFQPGVEETPMEEWQPEEVEAHLAYYAALNRELVATGELIQTEILTGPDVAKLVTSDGITAPVVTDGPFQEFKEWIAGFQVFDVDSEQRAIEIAARLSAVPGPGGRPIEQPIQVRRIMEDGPGTAAEMDEWLETAGGGARTA
ncbi:MAG: YciI family protein [Chloroflexota bacterium]